MTTPSLTLTQPEGYYSKYDLAQEAYPDFSVDSALPQRWLDRAAELLGGTPGTDAYHEAYQRIYNSLGWGYSRLKSDIMGRPLPLTIDGVYVLSELAAIAAFRKA